MHHLRKYDNWEKEMLLCMKKYLLMTLGHIKTSCTRCGRDYLTSSELQCVHYSIETLERISNISHNCSSTEEVPTSHQSHMSTSHKPA